MALAESFNDPAENAAALPNAVESPQAWLDGYARIRRAVQGAHTSRAIGRVTQVVGLIVESEGPPARVGEVCTIQTAPGEVTVAEVVGFRDSRLLLMPLGDTTAIGAGAEVVSTGRALTVTPGDWMLGRVLDGLGRPLDGGPVSGPTAGQGRPCPVNADPPPALRRQRIREPLCLGVRALDGIVTCGRGQRLGIFAGAGVGKSTLMGMIARDALADVNVIALIGERGRELREFIEDALQESGLRRSVVIAVTSDQPPLVRIKGALVAMTIAEFFRDRGQDVLMMMDSVTRFAWAQREVGLAVGEPPTRNGYTPSVFALLPRLLERSGMGEKGSITGLYTVLVEGDDMTEPVADAVRSILDGHVILSRKLATRGHYPAIDVLQSVSRLMGDVTSPEHRAAAIRLRENLATYKEAEDLISLGAYVSGSNPRIDRAISLRDSIEGFLKQGSQERDDFDGTVSMLLNCVGSADL
jgi:flagellum-specific ATP synthase